LLRGALAVRLVGAEIVPSAIKGSESLKTVPRAMARIAMRKASRLQGELA
jgi:hypothetical protein